MKINLKEQQENHFFREEDFDVLIKGKLVLSYGGLLVVVSKDMEVVVIGKMENLMKIYENFIGKEVTLYSRKDKSMEGNSFLLKCGSTSYLMSGNLLG